MKQKSEKVKSGITLWNFEATTVLAYFEKLKSRFQLIGRSSGVGSGGASAPPKVLICRKSGQSS